VPFYNFVDHVAQIIELLGPFPRQLALRGKYSGELFNRRGELRNIHRLKMWPLPSVLQEKYAFPRKEAEHLADFLLPMINIYPDKRCTPAESLAHTWLDGLRPAERTNLESTKEGTSEADIEEKCQ
jgi:serine/threonine protein kinase